uniref:Uncharacterized protein n=1 Tax=Megaviridae environmental sample TaxID=1737588 RepID=A0A5J6VIB2_9VIRU|nr:MAG: hypothetical protein [Megaviridae environmental sample]
MDYWKTQLNINTEPNIQDLIHINSKVKHTINEYQTNIDKINRLLKKKSEIQNYIKKNNLMNIKDYNIDDLLKDQEIYLTAYEFKNKKRIEKHKETYDRMRIVWLGTQILNLALMFASYINALTETNGKRTSLFIVHIALNIFIHWDTIRTFVHIILLYLDLTDDYLTFFVYMYVLGSTIYLYMVDYDNYNARIQAYTMISIGSIFIILDTLRKPPAYAEARLKKDILKAIRKIKVNGPSL